MLQRIISSLVGAALLASGSIMFASVTIYPAPSGESLATDFTVRIGDRSVPVYRVRVAPGEGSRRMEAGDYSANAHGEVFDEAAFTYFDMQGSVDISISYKSPVTAARLLPETSGIKLSTNGSTVRFTLSNPQNLTLEVNHDLVHSLHIFANPMETNAPSPNDPNVVYFGPGIHEVSNLVVGDGKTLYVAGGAIVKVVVGPNETAKKTEHGNIVVYNPAIKLQGSNIKVRGHGIIDGSGLVEDKGLLQITGQNISLDGIILRSPTHWTMPVQNSDGVTITNLKLLADRLNTDGIDIVSSHNVTVQGCFIRTFDDLIVVKTLGGKPASDIVARGNVLWNDRAAALKVGTEVDADVNNVTFADNDIIADFNTQFALRIFINDKSGVGGNVSGVTYENIRLNQICLSGVPADHCPGLIQLWVGASKQVPSVGLGSIRNVVFRNIQATSTESTPRIALAAHAPGGIDGVRFENVKFNGRSISKSDIKQNSFVKNVSVKP